MFVVNMLQEWWRDEVLAYRYGKSVFFSVALLLSCFGGYQGYQWYSMNKNKVAQHALAEAIDEFGKASFYALDEKNRNIVLADQYFKDAQLAFDVVDSVHNGSALISYSKAFEADIALQEGKFKEAIALLDAAIKSMSKHNPLYDMMLIKRALVLIDSGDVQDGLAALEKLAANDKGKHFDTAGFYAGYYYFAHDNIDKAIEIWKSVQEKMGKVQKKSSQSPWLVMIEEKLQQLGA